VKEWRGAEFPGEYPTLGWGVVAFIEGLCRVPGGPLAQQPFILTPEQKRAVLRAYEVHPRTGRRVVRRYTLRRVKKWGKGPLSAGIGAAELRGPVVFDGWDANGDPVGREHRAPWIQFAASAEDQTDNVMRPLINMLRDSPDLAALGIDLGRGNEQTTRVLLTGKGQQGVVEPVTARAGTREGQPITFAVADQTEQWRPGNGGVALAQVLGRNLAPMNGWRLDTPNAHTPGERSVAEMAWKDHLKAVAGLVYDWRPGTVDVPDLFDVDEGLLLAALAEKYGDSVAWVDLERIAAERLDEEMTPKKFRQFYLDVAEAPEDDVTGAERWAELFRPDAVLAPGDIIGLGFDGSESGDSTVLYACRWPDFTVFRLGSWERPEGEAGKSWRVPRNEVTDLVRSVHADYRVVRAYADPPLWRSELDQWRAEFLGADDKPVWIDWPTSVPARVGTMTERWAAMVEEGTLGHDGDDVLTRHLAAARRELTGTGGWWRPAKKDTRRIDAVVGAMNAVQALFDAVAKGLIPADDVVDVDAMVM
jgi:hypothetical protein